MKSSPRIFNLIACLLWAAFAASAVVSRAAEEKSANSEPQPSAPPPASGDTSSSRVENSVVKVFSTMRYPDLGKPWTKLAPTEVTGTGIVIEGKRILTNAHVVRYASQVQVQANQSGNKISATVEAIAYGIDLAVLQLEDESLFDTRPPLTRANTLPDNNARSPYQAATMVGLFPFLSDAPVFLRERGRIPDNELLDVIATFCMHEMGHLFLRYDEHYDHPHCVHVAPTGLNYYEWYKSICAGGPCSLEHRKTKRF